MRKFTCEKVFIYEIETFNFVTCDHMQANQSSRVKSRGNSVMGCITGNIFCTANFSDMISYFSYFFLSF